MAVDEKKRHRAMRFEESPMISKRQKRNAKLKRVPAKAKPEVVQSKRQRAAATASTRVATRGY